MCQGSSYIVPDLCPLFDECAASVCGLLSVRPRFVECVASVAYQLAHRKALPSFSASIVGGALGVLPAKRPWRCLCDQWEYPCPFPDLYLSRFIPIVPAMRDYLRILWALAHQLGCVCGPPRHRRRQARWRPPSEHIATLPNALCARREQRS
jgi:hypothetical protein